MGGRVGGWAGVRSAWIRGAKGISRRTNAYLQPSMPDAHPRRTVAATGTGSIKTISDKQWGFFPIVWPALAEDAG